MNRDPLTQADVEQIKRDAANRWRGERVVQLCDEWTEMRFKLMAREFCEKVQDIDIGEVCIYSGPLPITPKAEVD